MIDMDNRDIQYGETHAVLRVQTGGEGDVERNHSRCERFVLSGGGQAGRLRRGSRSTSPRLAYQRPACCIAESPASSAPLGQG